MQTYVSPVPAASVSEFLWGWSWWFEDLALLVSSLPSGSYNLSTSFSMGFPALALRVGIWWRLPVRAVSSKASLHILTHVLSGDIYCTAHAELSCRSVLRQPCQERMMHPPSGGCYDSVLDAVLFIAACVLLPQYSQRGGTLCREVCVLGCIQWKRIL